MFQQATWAAAFPAFAADAERASLITIERVERFNLSAIGTDLGIILRRLADTDDELRFV